MKLRYALDWRAILPLALGSAAGIPVGVYLLTYINPLPLRAGVGVILTLYSAYSLLRPVIGPFAIGIVGDLAIGFANEILGGLTGLGGIISTISCQRRGWPKDVQRGVFQPVLFAAFDVINVSMGFAGAFSRRRSVSMRSAFRFFSPVSGLVSSCTARSIMRPSANRSCCCY